MVTFTTLNCYPTRWRLQPLSRSPQVCKREAHLLGGDDVILATGTVQQLSVARQPTPDRRRVFAGQLRHRTVNSHLASTEMSPNSEIITVTTAPVSRMRHRRYREANMISVLSAAFKGTQSQSRTRFFSSQTETRGRQLYSSQYILQ